MTEWQMKDGDLIPDGAGGFSQLQGAEAVLQLSSPGCRQC